MTTPDFESIYESEMEQEMLTDAYNAITQCGLWDWIATYEPSENKGFMFSKHPNLTRIDEAMKYSGHSGASYGWTMRVMQRIAMSGGWETFKTSVLDERNRNRACYCRAQKGYKTGWCGVAGGGVPACDH